MAAWNSFSYMCTRALHSFRSFAQPPPSSLCCLRPPSHHPSIQPNVGHHRTNPPLTSTINTLLAMRYSFMLSTCPNHLNTLWSDLLYSRTPFLFQLWLSLDWLSLNQHKSIYILHVLFCSLYYVYNINKHSHVLKISILFQILIIIIVGVLPWCLLYVRIQYVLTICTYTVRADYMYLYSTCWLYTLVLTICTYTVRADYIPWCWLYVSIQYVLTIYLGADNLPYCWLHTLVLTIYLGADYISWG